MTASIDDVIRRIEDSGILDDVQLSEVRESAEAPDSDPETFVRLLVKNELLTVYQAQSIWQDKGHKLSFGNYVVESELGRGGMGVVLKARHKRMKRHVAIKVLPSTMTEDADAIARFQREVEAAAQLTHPNIVSAFDADEIDGQHFLVMEFVDGRDLSSVVRQSGRLPIEQAVNYTLQAARGLEFAHDQGVIHRDIKPANLLLDTRGTVRILDMGLARFCDTTDINRQAELTGTGTVMGTVDYMSPEQALNSKTADACSDIYSLGVTLYYLLTAKLAYEGDTLMARLVAHREHPIPSLQDDRSDVSDDLQRIFEKMAAKQASDRFQSMAEVIEALERCSVENAVAVLDASSALLATLNSSDDRDQFKLGPASDKESAARAHSLPATATLPRSESSDATVVTSSISNTIQDNVMASTSREPSNSVNSSWIAGKRILASGIGILLLVLVFSQLPKKPVENLPQSDVPVVNSSTPKTAPPTNDSSTAASDSVEPEPVPEPAPTHAVAPFDAEQAKAHQQAWADYLSLPVEYTHPCGMKFRLVPPGRFLMGASDDDPDASIPEKPQHEVSLTKPFHIGTTEVTIGQFRKFVDATGYVTEAESDGKGAYRVKPDERFSDLTWNRFDGDGTDRESLPVTCVSWSDAAQLCKWLGQQDDSAYRLPTEAEWEYACRAGTATRYAFGDDFDKEFTPSINQAIQLVGTYPANQFGLFDMHGNIHEICMDSGRTYTPEQISDPWGPESDKVAVRGGAVSSSVTKLRSSHRYLNDGRKSPDINFATPVKGFRVIRLAGDSGQLQASD